jgi:cell division protein FtsZ
VEAPELEDRVLVTVLASGFLEMDPDMVPAPAAAPVLEAQAASAEAPRVDTGRIYGEVPQSLQESAPLTPTRLLPQAPTPSGELATLAEDLHVPAIIRMTSGRLGIE